MSLWSSLSVGVTGLQTGSNALNTVAHNLTNVDTDGYTRQQVEQADRIYTTLSKTASKISYQQVGLGVYYSNVKQVRDYFLDKTYRQEVGREDFYSVSSGTLNEVEDLLGELQGTQFQKSLSDLWTSVQELTKDPCNSVTMGAFVSEANEFLFRAQGVYDGLSSFQDNLNYQVKQKVNQINELGKSLLKLNNEIRNVELGGVEHANDLRDERNLILDKLAELADISYKEDYFGNVEVQIEGEDFVKGGVCYEIGLKADNLTGFYTPFWPQNAEWHLDDMGNRDYDIENAQVFDLSRQISSELNTDIGGLKSILLARGDHRADYTDIETNPETGESNYDNISQSVLMNIQAEFDQLVHNTMRAINSVLEEAAGVKEIADGSGDAQTQALYDALKAGDEANGDYYDGKTYKLVKASDLTYMKDNDGSPLLLFKKQTTDSYEKVTIGGDDYWVYKNEDYDVNESLYTTANTCVNQNLLQTPTLLGFRLADGSEDKVTMDKLKQVFTDEIYTLNPNVLKRVSLNDYYGDLVSQVANSGYVYKTIHENQQNTVEATRTARDQVTAVSSDEELSNMIKFQSAYNASSRFINVVNEMLEHLLNSLAG